MCWPLDPGFGCAAAQRVPASRAGTRSQDVRQSSRSSVRSRPLHTDAPRPAPGYRCRHARVDGPERTSGRNASPSGITPSNISSPAHQPGPRTEVSLGARAHTTRSTQHAHAPPQLHARHRRHLTPHHQTSKRQRGAPGPPCPTSSLALVTVADAQTPAQLGKHKRRWWAVPVGTGHHSGYQIFSTEPARIRRTGLRAARTWTVSTRSVDVGSSC